MRWRKREGEGRRWRVLYADGGREGQAERKGLRLRGRRSGSNRMEDFRWWWYSGRFAVSGVHPPYGTGCP